VAIPFRGTPNIFGATPVFGVSIALYRVPPILVLAIGHGYGHGLWVWVGHGIG